MIYDSKPNLHERWMFPKERHCPACGHELPQGWPSLQEQREYWLKKEAEWVGCNGGENDHYFEEQQYSNYSEEQL